MCVHYTVDVFTEIIIRLFVLCVLFLYFIGSCADIMHSAQPFRNGFKESVIALILRDIITGLDYLHSLGFVHRCVYTHVYT